MQLPIGLDSGMWFVTFEPAASRSLVGDVHQLPQWQMLSMKEVHVTASESQSAKTTEPSRAGRQPRIVGFLCMSGAQIFNDLSHPARQRLPANFTGIAVECLLQVHAREIFKALLYGADGILLAACASEFCRHTRAEIRQHVANLWRAMESYSIAPSRLRLEWISASEEEKFFRVLAEMQKSLRRFRPLPAAKELSRNLTYCG